MVTLTANKIIIEIEDSNPENLLREFKHSIITILQHIDFSSDPNTKELETAHYILLKILKDITV